jgi:hypothetical protein
MTVGGIPLRYLHEVWGELWPLIEPAAKRSPDFSAGDRAGPDLLARLIAGDAQLHAVYEDGKPVAAIVTTIQVGPSSSGRATEKRCLLWLIGGSRVKEWAAEALRVIETWARELGCVALWGAGRPGWARIVKQFGGSDIGIVDGQPAWQRRIA